MEDALYCQTLGADALGFIFYEKSKRYVNPVTAANITGELSPFTLKVGVFANEPDIKKVRDIFYEAHLNIIQLHGDESYDYIKGLGLPVIKSFRINDGFDFNVLKKYPGITYLFDAHNEKGLGGTGEQFNWSVIPQSLNNKYILAGGISHNNLEDAIAMLKPMAIDVSSSLESEPGKKDKEKTKIFFNKLKQIRRKQCS